jgi:hypothetical protein
MKKSIIFILLLYSFPAFAEENFLPAGHRSLKNGTFVVETSEEDSVQSLDRISGHIDSGFAPKEETYQSENHYRAGPFGKTEAMDKLSREKSQY